LVGNKDGPAECQNAIWSDIFEDIEAASDWIARHGEEFGMQPWREGESKITIGGQSAGSHLSVYMAVNYPDKIDRAFLLYPPTDLRFFIENTKPHCENEKNCLFRCNYPMAKNVLPQYCGVASYESIDPTSDCITTSSFPEIIQKINQNQIPPMFLIQGGADSYTPVEMNIRLFQALAGKPLLNELYNGCEIPSCCPQNTQLETGPYQLRVVEGADHMLDLRCMDMDFFKGLPCTPGSKDGEKNVDKYLEEAYDFLKPN
jgi:acetyl esterase/lipase